ncbi:MAG: (2Fe-2S)-binding protein [Chromatiales bacterium]
MYICVCNAVNEKQLQQAISLGNSSIRELRRHLGFESCCGKCTACMRDMLQTHQRCHSETSAGGYPCKVTKTS